jgi:hypothetical protein
MTNAEPSPSFPPSDANPTLDAEVRYDIRSARGGRGGKVTAVANLWASGAILNQGASSASSSSKTAAPIAKVRVLGESDKVGNTDRDRGWEVMGNRAIEERQMRNADVLDNQQEISNPLVKPTPGTDTRPITFDVPKKTDKKTFSAALMSPAPPLPPKPVLAVSGTSNARNPASFPKHGPSNHVAEDQKRPAGRHVFSKLNISAKRPATAVSSPRPGSGSQSPQPSQGGRTTPMPVRQTSLSTPSSPGRSKPDMSTYPIPTAGPPRKSAGGGGLKPKPGMIIPPSTNPASVVLSSSHAVPHLSSTASLARPHAFRNVPPTAINTAIPASSSKQAAASSLPRIFPTMLSTSKSAPSLQAKASDTLSTPPPRVGSPSKLADLSFGQARLRDLIKKYQGQGA